MAVNTAGNAYAERIMSMLRQRPVGLEIEALAGTQTIFHAAIALALARRLRGGGVMSTRINKVLALPILLFATTTACARPASTPSTLADERAAAEAQLAESLAKIEIARREEREAIAERKLLLELRAAEAGAIAQHDADGGSQQGVADMQPKTTQPSR
jgi:hypothetical protein